MGKHTHHLGFNSILKEGPLLTQVFRPFSTNLRGCTMKSSTQSLGTLDLEEQC
jgi:hypothetical protein